jgi:hypothetical protein
MAIGDDFSVATNGDIRHVSGTTTYTGLELHRWLQDLADDEGSSGNDYVDIVTSNPSTRSTDQIFTLLDYSGSSGPTFNIDDDAAEYLYDCSITQKSGNEIYSGLQVLGAVNDTATQIMIIQDNDLYQFTTTPASPFWGDQSTGGYNGNSTAGILMQILVKSRMNGADIDVKKIRVQARHMDAGGGDSFSFFNTTLGEGVAVAALSTVNDVQNDTAVATVSGYTHVTNSGGTASAPTGGYQLIDLNNGAGPEPYYSQWTFGADTSGDGLKGIWEYTKELSYEGSTKTIDGLSGYLFQGVTHSFDYDGLTGSFNERELLVWGTKVFYDTLVSGPFTEGNYVTIGSNGAAGRVLYDDGVDELIIALEDTSITLLDDDVITEYSGPGAGATTTTAAINTTGGATVDNDKSGGTGWILADDATDTLWIQLLTGSAPVDNLPLRGVTSGATALVNGSASSKTVSPVFSGSYTGSYIGAFGVGFDPDDLSANELLTDLLGVNQTPPNNVTFSVTGVVSGEDRVLVGPRTGSDLNTAQNTLNGTLSGAAVTSVVVTTAIPSDTPSTGWIRVQNDAGRYVFCSYSSWTGSTFTITSTDFSTENATTGNEVFIGYIDKLAAASTESFTSIFSSTRDLFVRVRDGGATPIKQFESTTAQLTSTGGSVGVIRTTDA